MEQLLLHFIGDYWFQSDYLALNKSKKTIPCLVHCGIYTAFFLFLTHNPLALFLIFATHFLIDRFGLPRYFVWIKNHLNPRLSYFPWKECSKTGYHDIPEQYMPNDLTQYRPFFLTLTLYIVTDNSMHLLCNYLILKYV